jgi:hypothetical protein
LKYTIDVFGIPKNKSWQVQSYVAYQNRSAAWRRTSVRTSVLGHSIVEGNGFESKPKLIWFPSSPTAGAALRSAGSARGLAPVWSLIGFHAREASYVVSSRDELMDIARRVDDLAADQRCAVAAVPINIQPHGTTDCSICFSCGVIVP